MVKSRVYIFIVLILGLGIGTYYMLKESYGATKPQAVITCKNSVYTGSTQVIATCSGGTVANHKQSKIGSYKITCKGDANHENAVSKNCPIKKNDSITITTKTAKYSGKGIATTAKATSGTVVTLTYYTDSTCKTKTTTANATKEGGTPIAVGTYYAKGKSAGNATYYSKISSCTKAVVINKASDTVIITAKTATYTGGGVAATAKATSGSKVTITYYSDSACQTKTTTANATGAGGTPKKAGTYYAIAKSAGNANYLSGTSACTKAVVINKVRDTVNIVLKNATWTGKGIASSATATSGSKVTITYYSDTNCQTKTTTNNAISVGGAPKKAGTYYAIAKSAGNANYLSGTSACTKAVVIASKPLATITCSNKVYNGKEQSIATCKGGTIVNEKATNVGEYVVSCKGDDSHADASNTKCKILAINISEAKVSNIVDKVYTGNSIEQIPVVTINIDDTVKTLKDNEDYTYTVSNNLSVGKATITITGKGNFTGTKKVTFMITKPQALVTCDNKTYNQEAQIIATCSGGVPKGEVATNAGNYTVICEEDDNYATSMAKTCSILKATDSVSVTYYKANYTGNKISAKVSLKSNLTPTVEYYSDSTCTKVANPIEKGIYYVKVSSIGNENYQAITSSCAKAFEIVREEEEPELIIKIDTLALTVNNVIDDIANGKIADTITIKLKTTTYTSFPITTIGTSASGNIVTITYYSDAACKTKTTTSNASSIGGAPKDVGTYYAIGTTSSSDIYKSGMSACTKAVVINKSDDAVMFNNNNLSLKVNQTFQLQTKTNPINSKITWKTSSSAIATVNGNGVVKGIKEGTATITATLSNGKSSTVKVRVDKTAPTVSSCSLSTVYNSSTKTYNTTYTISASDAGGISKYMHNKKTYYTNKFTVISDTEDKTLFVYDNAGNYRSVKCDYPQIKSTSSSKLITAATYNSNTIKYWVEKPSSSYVITHVWVKDAAKQMKVASKSTDPTTLQKAGTIWGNAIKANNYTTKGMIGINASGFIMNNKSSDLYWNFAGWKNTKYHYSTRQALVINDGKTIRNWTSQALPTSVIFPTYAVNGNGYFTHYQFKGGESNISYNRTVVNQITKDGVKNTFSFHPILIDNYEIMTNNFAKEGSFCTSKNFRNAICQIDHNNFAIITNVNSSYNSDNISATDRNNGFTCQALATQFAKLKCKVAYNVDGGGSTSLRYKKNTSKSYAIQNSSREITDILYFVES